VRQLARTLAVGGAGSLLAATGACGGGQDTSTPSRPEQTGNVRSQPGPPPARPAGERSAAATLATSARTYSGTLTSGTGHYAHSSGSLTITLALKPTGTTTHSLPPRPPYAVSLRLHGAPCNSGQRLGAARGCLSLSGTLAGSVIEERRVAPVGDIPGRLRIVAASGRVSSLGAVVANGEMIGVGFIRRGRRSLRLTLVARLGTVSLTAFGPPVASFTAP